MSQKKKKKTTMQQPMSPTRFITEKIRSLEIGTCFMSADFDETGIGYVLVSRLHQNENISFAYFLVDIFCLGVKDCDYKLRQTKDEFAAFLQLFHSLNLRPCSYEEAHNMIYGAIAFAEEGGIKPHKNFGLTQYFLKEDTEDIPLIEYKYGRNGKHFLCAEDNIELTTYLPILQKTLGDKVEFIVGETETDDDYKEELQDTLSDYSFETPEYPSHVTLKHPWIYKELAKDNNGYGPKDEVIDRILALPHDEVRHDLAQLILYELGRFHSRSDEKQETNDVLLLAIILLSAVGNDKSLDCILECLHQPEEFYDIYIGDFIEETIMPTVYSLGQNQLDKLMKEMKIPGLYTFAKVVIPSAVAYMSIKKPQMRAEVIAWFHELLQFIITDPTHASSIHPVLVSFIIEDIIDIRAKELLPEIKTIVTKGLAEEDICGDFQEIEMEIKKPQHPQEVGLNYKETLKFLRGEK